MNKNQKTNVGARDCDQKTKNIAGRNHEPHGITLIALIITIIVLLILAGVAISITVEQDNLFDKAEQASIETNIGTIEEALNLHLLLEQKTIDEVEGFAKPLLVEDMSTNVNIIKDLSKIGVTVGSGKGTIPEASSVGTIEELRDVFVVDKKNKVSYVDKDGNLHGIIATIDIVNDTSGDWEVVGTTITKYLGNRATYENIVIPNYVNGAAVDTIGTGLFAGDGYAKTLKISEGIKAIEPGAFNGCSNLTGSLIIPNSVLSIGNAAFGGCTGLTGDLIIPNSVTTIGASTFAGCSNLTGNLIISNNVTTLGGDSFSGTNFKNLKIDIANIPNSAFSGCKFTGTLTIGEHVKTIGADAFNFCNKFTGELIIPNSVIEIGKYAFQGCSFTGDLVIPDSVTTIDSGAFSECENLNSIAVPNNVTTIGGSAFLRVKQVYYNGTLDSSSWGAINVSAKE